MSLSPEASALSCNVSKELKGFFKRKRKKDHLLPPTMLYLVLAFFEVKCRMHSWTWGHGPPKDASVNLSMSAAQYNALPSIFML